MDAAGVGCFGVLGAGPFQGTEPLDRPWNLKEPWRDVAMPDYQFTVQRRMKAPPVLASTDKPSTFVDPCLPA